MATSTPPAAFVAWFGNVEPDLPRRALLNETLPASIGLIAIVGFIISSCFSALLCLTRAPDKARPKLFWLPDDPLTGLANRALFAERLEHSPLPLTLLALDLDRFKAVNDTPGHEAGDRWLAVAERLKLLVLRRPTSSRGLAATSS